MLPLHIPEPIRFHPGAGTFAREIGGLRHTSGVYALCAAPDTPLHLSWSSNLERRLKRLFIAESAARASPTGPLRAKVESVHCWPAASQLELSLLLYRLAKHWYPERYLRFLKLRPPWFVGISREDPFPRLEITDRPGTKIVPAWGPFRTRAAAQLYEAEVTGLFQLRRCSDVLMPDPEHPGCVYGEMNQCLRPCQCAASASEYASETQRVAEFLGTNGQHAIAVLAAARDRACEEAAFEQAAQVHKRIEKLKSAAQLREPVIAEVQGFNGVALTASLQPSQYLLWPMLGGIWQQAIAFDVASEASESKSLDTCLRELLTHTLAHSTSEGNPTEELAIFSRWYYSSWRDGQWFSFSDPARFPYRKLVRELSKMASSNVIR